MSMRKRPDRASESRQSVPWESISETTENKGNFKNQDKKRNSGHPLKWITTSGKTGSFTFSGKEQLVFNLKQTLHYITISRSNLVRFSTWDFIFQQMSDQHKLELVHKRNQELHQGLPIFKDENQGLGAFLLNQVPNPSHDVNWKRPFQPCY